MRDVADKVMHIGQNNNKILIPYNINQNKLTVVVDETTTVNCYQQYILITFAKAAAKANSVLGVIKRTFSNLSQDIFTKLYKSMVCPHLEYGSCIWSPRLKRENS